jgi:hypothetical protein
VGGNFGFAVGEIGDHGNRRAGGHVVIQFVEDGGHAPVPAEDERAFGLRGGERGASRGRRVDGVVFAARKHNSVVVFGDGDDLVSRGEDGVHGRVELDAAIGKAQAHHRGAVVGRQRFAVGFADEGGFGFEVDFVTAEIEQFGVDDGEARLAAGLHGDARDEAAHQHQFHFVAAHHAGGVHVARVVDFGHDVVWRGAAVGAVGDGQYGFDDVRVGVVAFGRKDDDGFAGLQADHVQVVEVNGAAGAANHAGAAEFGHAVVDGIFHFHFVFGAQDDDARPALVCVGDGQFGDDGEHLRRPAEDDGVAAFDDVGAAFAQFVELVFDAVVDDADEGADDEDAAEGDGEHAAEELRRAAVAAHGAGIEGAQQGHPHQLAEAEVGGVGDPDDEGDEEDDGEGGNGQPDDQGNGAFGHEVVELVAQAVGDGRIFHGASWSGSGCFYFHSAVYHRRYSAMCCVQ